MGLARRPWFVLILFSLLIFATRWPLAPGQLFTFDDVNLAGAHFVWLLNPRTGFFPLGQAGTVYSTELPPESGSRRLGEYELVW